MTPTKSREISNLPASEVKFQTQKWIEGLIFPIVMWLLSRLVIVAIMQLIAPLVNSSFGNNGYLPPIAPPNFVAKSGWELFSHWDGVWYQKIATLGYDYANDGQQHSIAFFPLFPLLTRGVMTLGLPFEVAGTLVNNLALLGAMILLYRWAEKRYGIKQARWATAVLAWCPFSLFGTVIYTEGLFLLLTTAALQAFDNRQHVWAALWGAMAAATRPTGMTLIPAFFLVAWKERRPAIAYAASVAVAGGLLLFSVYCAICFGDPLAFVRVQRAWPHPHWSDIFVGLFTVGKRESFIRVSMLFGGGYLLWHLRAKLPPVSVAYGFCSLALIVASGALSSVGRFAYGIVSLSLALGVLLACYPRWGYAVMGLFAILLVEFAIKFSWWGWVA